jgi:hypothetical protein
MAIRQSVFDCTSKIPATATTAEVLQPITDDQIVDLAYYISRAR